MRILLRSGWSVRIALLAVLLLGAALPSLRAEPLTLRRAVELALAHSTTSAIAAADEQRAFQSYKEVQNAYLPQLIVGSGLGFSYGFPLSLEGSAPALFNVTAQSTVFNLSQREFQRAARREWNAATTSSQDQRNQVLQDTVLAYAALARWEQQLALLRAEEADSRKMEGAVQERIREGVDSALERDKARLATARTHLRIAQVQGSADVLRTRLSQVTGLPASGIETVADSIPALPAVTQQEDLPEKAAASSPAVKAAAERAEALQYRALGEHRALLPSLDFAAQYSLLARFNNYDEFFNKFQRHNATVGVAIRFPFLNWSQQARAKAADAEALKARKEAQAAKDQVSAETLRLQRTVEQLVAAREVAELEYQVAQAGLGAMQTRMEAGTGTLHELEDARNQANVQRNVFLDTSLELDRARITLLRSTGDLEKWALEGK
jgi:outer membrane protein TolC